MTLLACHDQVAVEGTAPADFDRVPEFFLIAWLAENAVVEFLAALGSPFQELRRPVHSDAFLVAGDKERNRPFGLPVMCSQMIENGRDRAGDAALHVHRATPVHLTVGDLARERRMFPRL